MVLPFHDGATTNSLIEVIPLIEIDGKPVGSGRPGPLTQRLMTAYKELMLQVQGERAG